MENNTYEERVLAGLKVVSNFRKQIGDGIIIENAVVKIGDDTFKIEKRGDKKYEYTVHMNDEYIKCAEDNTPCRNNGRCLHCGYCL